MTNIYFSPSSLMQLFLTPFTQTGNTLTIQDKNLLQQMRKVLRFQLGVSFCVQDAQGEKVVRHKVILKDWDDKHCLADIESTEEHKIPLERKTMLIAMPNKRQKAEMIVQKLTEIGIEKIIFRPAERSVIKQANPNKMERLEKIAQEALEQSRGRQLPHIQFVEHIKTLIKDQEILVFDYKEPQTQEDEQRNYTMGIVGPE